MSISNKRLSFALLLLLCSLGLVSPSLHAQLGGRSAEEWIKTLESPGRIAGLKIDETIARLQLKPTDIVADIGAGSGAWEAALAKAVPQGKVYAVDIEQGLLDNINRRAKEFQILNIETVLGAFTDPKLPVRTIDVAFIYDVWHHIQDRETYVKSLAGYLKPTGRVAVVEFIPERGGHRGQPEMQISPEQGAKMMAAAGLKPIGEIAGLFEDKWFVIYGK